MFVFVIIVYVQKYKIGRKKTSTRVEIFYIYICCEFDNVTNIQQHQWFGCIFD